MAIVLGAIIILFENVVNRHLKAININIQSTRFSTVNTGTFVILKNIRYGWFSRLLKKKSIFLFFYIYKHLIGTLYIGSELHILSSKTCLAQHLNEKLFQSQKYIFLGLTETINYMFIKFPKIW